MKISAQELQHSLQGENISSEMEFLVGKLQNNYIGRCKQRMRSSPYCVVKHWKAHSLINDSSFLSSSSSSHHIVPKCSKCLSRNCGCSIARESTTAAAATQSAITDSVTLLRQLLRKQTLIQEAVHRLQTRTSHSDEFQFEYDVEDNSLGRPSAAYTSYESESESDVDN